VLLSERGLFAIPPLSSHQHLIPPRSIYLGVVWSSLFLKRGGRASARSRSKRNVAPPSFFLIRAVSRLSVALKETRKTPKSALGTFFFPCKRIMQFLPSAKFREDILDFFSSPSLFLGRRGVRSAPSSLRVAEIFSGAF